MDLFVKITAVIHHLVWTVIGLIIIIAIIVLNQRGLDSVLEKSIKAQTQAIRGTGSPIQGTQEKDKAGSGTTQSTTIQGGQSGAAQGTATVQESQGSTTQGNTVK